MDRQLQLQLQIRMPDILSMGLSGIAQGVSSTQVWMPRDILDVIVLRH